MLEIKDKKVNETILSLLLKIWPMAWELWCLLKPARKAESQTSLRSTVVFRVLQRNRTNRKRGRQEERDFIIRNRLTRLWRLTSPKIHRVTWQARDTGGQWCSSTKADKQDLRSRKNWWINLSPKGRKTPFYPTSKVIKQENLYFLGEEVSLFCSTQAFN